MTNSIILLTALSTNWLPMTLTAPNGDGTTYEAQKEIGIVVSNRYAQFVADGKTNKVLVSSEALPPKAFLIRDKTIVITSIYTNGIFTNWAHNIKFKDGQWVYE